ncbi:hypothetical protein [Dactylosporangium cerinum]
MQAVVVNNYGPPEEYLVGELPAPRPGRGSCWSGSLRRRSTRATS